MEKETRMSRYKALRERVRSEMEIEFSVSHDDNIEDDFLLFINKKEENEIVEDEYVSGKYDTKMEILNIVKSYNKDVEKKPSLKDKFQHLTHKKDKEKKLTFLEKLARLSTKEDVKELNKFIEEEKTVEIEQTTKTEEKQVSEVSKDEMDSSLLDFVALLKKDEVNKAVNEVEKEQQDKDLIEEDDESKLGKIIDIIIVGLIVLLAVFLLLIIKQLF